MQTKMIRLLGGVLMMGLLASLTACQKQEGPAERAGKSVDNAVQKAGEKIEQAGDKVQDAARDAKK